MMQPTLSEATAREVQVGSPASLPAPSRARSARSRRGFSFLEVLIVLSLLGLLVAIALPAYRDSVTRAKEAALRQTLYRVREAIDEYNADQHGYPGSLEDLVTKGYLRSMPVDPITETSDTWQVEYAPYSQLDSGEVTGIWDLRSGAEGEDLEGTPYSEY
jgi:general secretion pathway protein G